MKRPVEPEEWGPAGGVVLDARSLAAVKAMASSAIVAGPGAGKTELLAQRAAYLLETDHCPSPRRILAISFKRDAAKNLRERVAKRVGDDLAGRLESYTFDAFAKSLVDRFGAALPAWCRPRRDYALALPGWRDWRDFTDQLQTKGVSVTSRQLELGHATLTARAGPLPIAPAKELLSNRPGVHWWAQALKRDPQQLTFGMISTLAMTVLHHNPQILGALRQTYSHVFLDEFQDTTDLQYSLLSTAFLGSPAVITAVGDSKQRIMTFAGARAGIFQTFSRDFQADLVALTTNFRSNRRIVEIVNAMAVAIEPDAAPVSSAHPNLELPEPADGVLTFDDEDEEAAGLAETIAGEVDAGKHRPEDFMLLVRQAADKVEPKLALAFAAQGMTLRNEARALDGVQIQELMTEPLADLVIGVLQMAADDRTDNPFHRVRSRIASALGGDRDQPAAEMKVERVIRDAVRNARDLVALEPDEVNGEGLAELILSAFGDTVLARLSPDYARPARLNEIRTSTGKFLAECCDVSTTWLGVIGQFLGRAQVKLMTIHKSKGLEAHTVIFLHLQDDAFHWQADMEEERLAFFVAASRARERFFITTTNKQSGRVGALWDMVSAAGMAEVE